MVGTNFVRNHGESVPLLGIRKDNLDDEPLFLHGLLGKRLQVLVYLIPTRGGAHSSLLESGALDYFSPCVTNAKINDSTLFKGHNGAQIELNQ